MAGIEQLEIHSKSYIVRWVKVDEGHTISWSLQPHKKSINFAIVKHPGSGGTAAGSQTFEATATPEHPATEAAVSDAKSGLFRRDASTAQDQLAKKGFIPIQWHGKCEADKVTVGTYDVTSAGMYGLVFDNTFSKQTSKTATFVLLTYPTGAPPQTAHHLPTVQAGAGSNASRTSLGAGTTPRLGAANSDSVDSLPSNETAGRGRAASNARSEGGFVPGATYHVGVLLKRRRKKGQGFARRFFSLDFTTCTLSYYHNRNSSALRGAIPLSLAAIAADERRREITIDSGAEIWHLKASGPKDFNDWAKALEKASRIARGLETLPNGASLGVDRPASRPSTSVPSAQQEDEREWAQVEALVSRVAGTRDALRRLVKDMAAEKQAPGASQASLLSPNTPAIAEDAETYFTPSTESRRPFWKRKTSNASPGAQPGVQATAGAALAVPSPASATAVAEERNPYDNCAALLNDLDSVVVEFSQLLSKNKRRRIPSQMMPPNMMPAASRKSYESTASTIDEFFDAEAGEQGGAGQNQVMIIRQSEEDMAGSDAEEVDIHDSSSVSSVEEEEEFEGVGTENHDSLFPVKPKSLAPLPITDTVTRRTTIPAAKVPPPSLIAFVRKNVGKDLSTISMPVSANEPLSLCQRMAEQLEYGQLLTEAAKKTDANERLLYVTAFAVSQFSNGRAKERATRKPFNPLLGETFELVRSENEVPGGFRVLVEKICHRPVRLAVQADSALWSFSQSPAPSQKFWGKSAEITTEGRVRVSLHLPDGTDELYSWHIATVFLRNVVYGEKYVEPVGNMNVNNETSGAKAVVEFRSAKGMFGGRGEEVHVETFGPDGSNTGQALTGNWTSSLKTAPGGKEIWKAGSLVPNAANTYGFTTFAASLNEITPLEKDKLPPTDSRLRPDQRFHEQGDLDSAEEWKVKLEEAQRVRRKQMEERGEEYKPKWFVKVATGQDGEEVWKLKGGKEGYWEERAKSGGQWTGVLDIFSGSTLRALHSQAPSLPDQSQPTDAEFEANHVRRRQHTTTEIHDSGENPAPAAQTPTEPPPPPLPREEAQEQAHTQTGDIQDGQNDSSPAKKAKKAKPAKPKRGRDSGLVNRLAKVPVRAHPVLESVFVRPVTEYPDQYETRGSVRTHMKDNHRQKMVMGTRVPTNRTDWRAALRNLLQSTPMYLPEQFADNVKVIIPRETAPRLLSDSEYSVWDIKSRTNCGMVLYRAGDAGYEEGTEDQQPYLIIWGHHDSVNTAIDEILGVTRKVTIISRTKGTEEVLWNGKVDSKEPIVFVSAHRTPSQLAPYDVNIRADEFPKPEEWTRKTFEEYVDALIKSRMPSALASKLYPEHGWHEMAVIEQLVAVFNDEVAAQFVTNAAFKMALHYMTRGGETWRPEVLSMFNYAKSGRVRLDVGVFNILAEAAVKTRSLYRFSAVLYLLVTHGYQPNLRTWILFLRMFEAEEVKRYVLQAMHDRGLFNARGALRMVADEMAPHDAYRAVQLGWDVPTFLAKQDELYGANRKWVSIDALNKIFHVFGSYSMFAEIRQLLDLVFAGKLIAYPDQVTVNTILAHCKAQKKLDLAVEFIQLFEGHRAKNNETPLKLDNLACDILFDLAQWQKKPHVLSTIWRYAHLVNSTTFHMRQKGTILLKMDAGKLKEEKSVRRLKLGDEERVLFVRNLLLGEFIQANGGDEVFGKIIAGIAKGEQEHQQKMEEIVEQEEDDDDRIPPSLGNWFHSQSLLDPSSSPTIPPSSSSAAASLPASSSNPDHNRSSIPQLQLQTSNEPELTTWGNIYGSFRSWSFASKYLYLEPSAPIGSLLQQALDRDRELHLALRTDGLDRHAIEELMKPVEIPTKLRPKPAFEEVKTLFEREGEVTKRGVKKVGVKEGDRDGDEEVQEAMALGPVDGQALDKWLSGDEVAPTEKNAHVDETAAAAVVVAAAAKPNPSSLPDESKKVVAKGSQENKVKEEEEAHKRSEKETMTTTSKSKTSPPAPTQPTTSPLTTSSPLPISTTSPQSTKPTTKPPTKEIKTKEEAVNFKLRFPSSSSSSSTSSGKRVKWEDLADL
ncbi:Oxysterol-binding protein-domain-containing protein [Neurospora crassa]|nr:Oxysterol-binding protein-domain-containing protein [Neurospora crassa]